MRYYFGMYYCYRLSSLNMQWNKISHYKIVYRTRSFFIYYCDSCTFSYSHMTNLIASQIKSSLLYYNSQHQVPILNQMVSVRDVITFVIRCVGVLKVLIVLYILYWSDYAIWTHHYRCGHFYDWTVVLQYL